MTAASAFCDCIPGNAQEIFSIALSANALVICVPIAHASKMLRRILLLWDLMLLMCGRHLDAVR